MNTTKGRRPFLLEVNVELCQAILPPEDLALLKVVSHEANLEHRLRFLREKLKWPAVLAIAVGISTQEKQELLVHGEIPFCNGDVMSPVTVYFSNGELVMRHWYIAYNLYWSLHPLRINEKWVIPVVVRRFFRPRQSTYTTTDDYAGTINRILDACPTVAVQCQAFAMAGGLYRYTTKQLGKRYKIKKTDVLILKWGVATHFNEWEWNASHHWNLSCIWWEVCVGYVDAMMTQYDVRMDFIQHSLRGAYPGREKMAILSLGERVQYYCTTGVDLTADEMGLSAMDHCLEWMAGTSHGEHVEDIPKVGPKLVSFYRAVLSTLFFRRLHIQAQWDAAASRGVPPWAEGRYRGRLVYLRKEEVATTDT